MTLRNGTKVLSLSVAVICCVFLFAVLWQELRMQYGGVHFYEDVAGAQVTSPKSKGTVGQQEAHSRTSTSYTVNAQELQLENTTSLPFMQKESFSKMPTWEFEDQYIQNPHPKRVTCQSSFRRTADLEFNRSFVPNIQLFMQREHLNVSEWNRLAHFNNPFGFMGYHYRAFLKELHLPQLEDLYFSSTLINYMTYNDIKKAVDLIPEVKDYNLLPVPSTNKSGCVRCAVVGTGGILNGSRMGKEIDSHDYVFRMNGAVVRGHEEDVGSRTSVYVHTAHSLVSSHYTLQKYGFSVPSDEGIKYVLIPEGLRDFQWLYGLVQKKSVTEGIYAKARPWTFYPGELDMNKFYVLHPDFFRYVKNRFMKSEQLQFRYWHLYRPTNGAFTMFLALHSCDVVDAYGFMTTDYSKYSNYYFETVTKTSVVFYLNHDYKLEMNLWKKLHDSKVIRLYQREKDRG